MVLDDETGEVVSLTEYRNRITMRLGMASVLNESGEGSSKEQGGLVVSPPVSRETIGASGLHNFVASGKRKSRNDDDSAG